MVITQSGMDTSLGGDEHERGEEEFSPPRGFSDPPPFPSTTKIALTPMEKLDQEREVERKSYEEDMATIERKYQERMAAIAREKQSKTSRI
ncbi:hypothetical protein [Enterobacter cloacae complex sp. GF14B]|uniref:hypothetical protein n=1 Tax=Enterobacter cloacae complex sp. GF14B TaxID=2511982 RepID=UPI00100FC414|nr:hypothetical protein [Enterobacter cloacae complex sp. GF14B]RYA43634.1 hypothetical protein DD606_25305 [Enterobacter cloacae complex sp. GF14B]